MEVDEFLELQASSRRSTTTQKVDVLLARLAPGDTLLVSELSRLGRSVGEIITLIDTLVTQQIRVFTLKEGLPPEMRGPDHSRAGSTPGYSWQWLIEGIAWLTLLVASIP